jgi:hypothetical protein
MKITVESTSVIVQLDESLRAARWEGATESGIPVVALVAGISPQTDDWAVATRFAAELEEPPDPPEGVDGRRGKVLAAGIMGSVLAALAGRPPGLPELQIVLNALAATAATLIVGTDEERARDFFNRAMAQSIVDLRPESTAPRSPDVETGGWKATLFSGRGDDRPIVGALRTTQRLHWTQEQARAEARRWLSDMRLEPITSWDAVDDRWTIGRSQTHYVIVRSILLPLGEPPAAA